MTPEHERWKIGDRRLHGQPRGWFPGPWWLVDLEEEASEREDGDAADNDGEDDEPDRSHQGVR